VKLFTWQRGYLFYSGKMKQLKNGLLLFTIVVLGYCENGNPKGTTDTNNSKGSKDVTDSTRKPLVDSSRTDSTRKQP
jgi:hypothetical protein